MKALSRKPHDEALSAASKGAIGGWGCEQIADQFGGLGEAGVRTVIAQSTKK
jgi:hypothetical protein